MPIPAQDIVTKRLQPRLASPHSRIIDLQVDPRGGYWALVDVPQVDAEVDPAFLLRFDDTHNLLSTHAFSITNPTDLGYDVINVAAMSVGPNGILVVGTSSWLRHPGLPSKVFVARFSVDGIHEAVMVYDPLLLDGCEVPGSVQCRGVGIVRLAPPEDDRLMVLCQTASKFDGRGLPLKSDAIGAGVFLIDNDGNQRSAGITRIFGQGQLIPSRLRLLPNLGPTIVGRTRLSAIDGPWWGFYARLDSAGTVVAEASYTIDNMRDVALNDVAEGGYSIITVGTGETFDTSLRAVALHIEADGRADWIGVYDRPPDAEFFGTQLNALMARDDVFIAAGGYWTPSGTEPWLLRLSSASPDPIWQKRYPIVHGARLPGVFETLLVPLPNGVIAGGDTPDEYEAGPPALFDRVPFLAMSEIAAGTGAPACSVETFAVATHSNVDAIPPAPWMDRIPLTASEWLLGYDEPLIGVDTLCRGNDQSRP